MHADKNETPDSQDFGARMRLPNGVISGIILCFFVFHAALGVAWRFGMITGSFALAIWLGVILMGLHMVMSIATSYSMVTDTVRPPSAQKKRHLVLKWVTGGIVVAVAIAHISLVRTQGGGIDAGMAAMLTMLVLLAALAVHGYTGVKSLTRDLGINKKWRLPLRIAIIAVCAAIGIVMFL